MKIDIGEESLEVILNYQYLERAELIAMANQVYNNYKNNIITSWSVSENNLKALKKATGLLNSKLGNYTGTFVTTYKTQFEQLIKDLTANNTSGENYWVYVGPDDSKTRQQCQDGLIIKYFTDAEKNAFNAEGLRYNCRHTFDLITEAEYEAGIK